MLRYAITPAPRQRILVNAVICTQHANFLNSDQKHKQTKTGQLILPWYTPEIASLFISPKGDVATNDQRHLRMLWGSRSIAEILKAGKDVLIHVPQPFLERLLADHLCQAL